MAAPTSNSGLFVPQTLQGNLPPSGGSATGNPRNKCALKPGHSLMDWVRLGSSGEDLAGTRGAIRQITLDELAKHNNQKDAWMAIRGKVFNVTRYMDFHPGGVDELMKGVGKDATKLFDDVHAWVNFEQLLSKCFLGPLKITPTIQTKSSITKEIFLPPPMTVNTEIVPRFDWIQTSSELSITFYTKALSNPGFVISKQSDQEIEVQIYIGSTVHTYSLVLLQNISWPCKANTSSQTGKIEISFKKSMPQLWTSYGNYEYKKGTITDHKYNAKIDCLKRINHDSFKMILTLGNVILGCPVGYHITIMSEVNGDEIGRSFTPIDQKFYPGNDNEKTSNKLFFLIKSYENGTLSKYITRLEDGSVISMSQPKGTFALSKLQKHRKVGLFAAGSGLTPILAVLDHLLGRTTNRCEEIVFYYFNKTTEDIWCKEKLTALSEKDQRLQLNFVLSDPESSWTGKCGRISHDIVKEIMDSKSPEHTTFNCVCGPPGFNDLFEQLLKTNGFDINNLHIFKG